MGCVEYGELKKLVNTVNKKFNKENIDKFFVDTSQVLTKELYNKLWVNTPVRTGFLRRGFDVWNRHELEYWNLNNYNYKSYNNKKFSIKNKTKQMQYKTNFDNIQPIKDNNKYTVHIRNPVYYAKFVEYGHSQKVGRYVPAINARLKKNFVHGRFYLKKSVNQLKKEVPQIVKKEFNKFLKG